MASLLLSLDISLVIAAYVVLALAYTAVVDARTGLVPPMPLAIAAMAVMADLISNGSVRAATAPLQAGLFYMGVWALNELHYRCMGRDALGMGDAHWSLVATLAFGWQAVLMAWGVGAWLALLWLGIRKLLRKPAGHVYFVPFLFVALAAIMLWPVLVA